MGAVFEFATVEATHDFDPQALGLNRAKSRTLLIYKGDKFKVFSMPNREWWGARCLSNDNIGYIPSAYVKPMDSPDKEELDKRKTEMDIAAIAAIAKEVKINAKAKQTGNDKTSTELGNILTSRQQGTGAPIRQRKEEPDSGVSSELQKLLAKRNKIIEEDEQLKEKSAAEPEFFKVSLKKTGVKEVDEGAGEDDEESDNEVTEGDTNGS